MMKTAQTTFLLLLTVSYCCYDCLLVTSAFHPPQSSSLVVLPTTTTPTRRRQHSCHRSIQTTNFPLYSTPPETKKEIIHPAVEGWPDKYSGNGPIDQPSDDDDDNDDDNDVNGIGPRILHTKFTIERATEEQLTQLDVFNWPIWTTSDKEKWIVGNRNCNKVMPYGELSYVLQGKLEIIVDGDKQPHIISKGDLVTFPKGFQSDWCVLEPLTWHYYLY